MTHLPALHASLALPLAVLLAGVVAAWVGWRGRRVGDHPTCRRCGFDLFGRPAESLACPECGADLRARGAVRTGTLVRRRGLVAAGVLLLLAGGAWLGTGAGRQIYKDPNAWKPAWWLAREAFGRDADRQGRAMWELNLRLKAGRLSAGRVASIVESALRRQGDPRSPWLPRWGTFVEGARDAGEVSDETWRRYVRQAAEGIAPRLDVRPRVRRGDPFPVYVRHDPPRLGSIALAVDWSATLAFDDLPPTPDIDLPNYGLVPLDWDWDRGVLLEHGVPYPRLKDGRRKVTLSAVMAVFGSEGLPPVEVPMRIEAAFELVPADAPAAGLDDDPAHRPALERALRPKIVPAEGGRDGPSHAVEVTVMAGNLPVGVACDVIVREGGREWNAGTLCVGPDHGVRHWRRPRVSRAWRPVVWTSSCAPTRPPPRSRRTCCASGTTRSCTLTCRSGTDAGKRGRG